MGIDIRFYKVDKNKWRKEKEELENIQKIEKERNERSIETVRRQAVFQEEAEFFDGSTSVYHSMIYIIKELYSRKGKALKFEEYPLYWEKVLVLESKDFLDLILAFKNRISYLKETSSEPGPADVENSGNISDEYYIFDHEAKTKEINLYKYAFRKLTNYQYRLLDFEDEIDGWIKEMQATNYEHENFEYLIGVE
ncbi:MAG: hypothetical protein KDC44_19595 [Phaeodactylibacter sp.]|nr:hypothetical protein [Phaeodactylibacter sp.]